MSPISAPVPIRFTDEDSKLLARLQKRLGLTTPGVVRLALRALHRQETSRSAMQIEVYEWREGAARPGTTAKPRDSCIDILEIPTGGQVPQVEDVILITAPGEDPFVPARFRVLSRELMWIRTNDDSQKPQRWSKMWLHVRRIEDETR